MTAVNLKVHKKKINIIEKNVDELTYKQMIISGLISLNLYKQNLIN